MRDGDETCARSSFDLRREFVLAFGLRLRSVRHRRRLSLSSPSVDFHSFDACSPSSVLAVRLDFAADQRLDASPSRRPANRRRDATRKATVRTPMFDRAATSPAVRIESVDLRRDETRFRRFGSARFDSRR